MFLISDNEIISIVVLALFVVIILAIVLIMHKKAKPKQEETDEWEGVYFFINMDGTTYGPFTYAEMMRYPLLPDTLVTTNTLNGQWHEARQLDCFEEKFNPQPKFKIAEDGTIIRKV